MRAATFAAATTCSITGLTGVVSKAVVSCYDNSGTLTEIIPNDFAGTTADTLVVKFQRRADGVLQRFDRRRRDGRCGGDRGRRRRWSDSEHQQRHDGRARDRSGDRHLGRNGGRNDHHY